MQKDPYVVLDLNNEATREEVEEAYYRLKKKYSELRFEEGEVGANASKALDELEKAYRDCLDDIRFRQTKSTYGNAYGEVVNLIKENKLEEAQDQLDEIEPRDAEWHYTQAQIYYKRQWHSEAKNQLEIACDLDPENQKYKNSLKKLVNSMNRESNQDSSYNNSQSNSRAGYQNPRNSSYQSSDDACCNACSTLVCLDCCCECMGGDLIPCC